MLAGFIPITCFATCEVTSGGEQQNLTTTKSDARGAHLGNNRIRGLKELFICSLDIHPQEGGKSSRGCGTPMGRHANETRIGVGHSGPAKDDVLAECANRAHDPLGHSHAALHLETANHSEDG